MFTKVISVLYVACAFKREQKVRPRLKVYLVPVRHVIGHGQFVYRDKVSSTFVCAPNKRKKPFPAACEDIRDVNIRCDLDNQEYSKEMMWLTGCLILAWSGVLITARDVPQDYHAKPSSQPHILNFSSPSPHIFASTFGLLQQWPNTFFPYGHSIVPCEVPINTNLYHARIDGDLPPSPEWFAFDAAMSYSIAGMLATSNMLTYRTTRNIKCIYFNGMSAALNGAGNMDTQMVFIHNNSANIPDEPPFGPGKPNNHTSGDPNGPMLGAEYDRADALCAYIKDNKIGGKGWGYEGIIRMNAGFEMIFCDFESESIRLISHLNSSVPTVKGREDRSGVAPIAETLREQVLFADDGRPHGPPQREPEPLAGSARLGWLMASANQYGLSGGVPGRGESRVRLDTCGIFTFYDPELKDQERSRIVAERKSLNISSSGEWQGPEDEAERKDALRALERRRRSHRADHVSKADGTYMLGAIAQHLEGYLHDSHARRCSGVDWRRTLQDIVLEYSTSMHDLLKLLRDVPVASDDKDGDESKKRLFAVRKLVHLMAMPYYQYPLLSEIEASPKQAFDVSTDEAQSAFARCRDHHSPLGSAGLSDSEELLFSSTTEVLGSICHVILTTFLSVETLWYADFETTGVGRSGKDIGKTMATWRHNLQELMAWLGWADQWTACKGCSADEICWIPMWPLSFMTRPRSRETSTLDGPPPDGGGPPDGGAGRRPGFGHGYGPGYRGPHPPGFGMDDDLLWEPQCMSRAEVLLES